MILKNNKKIKSLLAILFIGTMMVSSCGKPGTVQIIFDENHTDFVFDIHRVTTLRNAAFPIEKIPQISEREDYVFTYWYKEKECKNIYNFDDLVTEQFTLYAGWEENFFTITYDDNHDKGTTCNQKVKKNTTTTPLSQPSVGREGYTFTSWYKEKECNNLFDFSSPIEKNETVYAGWVSTSSIY